jgi:hypothetical protein
MHLLAEANELTMSDEQVQRSIQLQQAISERLAELAFADSEQAQRIGRHMAEVATRGKTFADDTLPLFLQMPRDDLSSVSNVALAVKSQLEELADTLNDLRRDLADWADFFYPRLDHK